MSNSENYKVSIDHFGEMDIERSAIENLDVQRVSKNEYLIQTPTGPEQVMIESFDLESKKATILVNDKRLNVVLKNQLDILIDEMGYAEAMKKGFTNLTAPMPGLVLEIKVNVGDQIETGQPLLVLEAMKMENVIKSPGDGIIKEILVSQGDKVNKAQILIDME